MGIVRGNKLVRTTDPATSHRAVVRLVPRLAKRKAQCFAIIDRLGPCTRNDIREQAQKEGFSPSVAETIRRRATDLIEDKFIHVIDGSGDSEVLWFVPDDPAPVAPLPPPPPPRKYRIVRNHQT